MPNRWYPLLFDIIFVVSILSPFAFITWAWIRALRKPMTADNGWRTTVGSGALWLVTGQMLAGLVVLVLVMPRYEFPHNVEIWLDWSRIVFVLSAVAIMLALIGRTRARVQILLCAIAMCWACIILASLA